MSNTQKKNPLMICHFILMVLLALGNLVVGIWVIANATSGSLGGQEMPVNGIFFTGLASISYTIALCFGVIYLIKGYSKNAAVFYKLFLLLTALAVAFYVAILFSLSNSEFASIPMNSSSIRIYGSIFMGIKILSILILTFGLNLGKRISWMLFCIAIISDILLVIFFFTVPTFTNILVVASLACLIMDGTIGLAIKGKFDDKDSRGSK